MDFSEIDNYKLFLSDIRTARIVSNNDNFNERLYEAYLRIKELDIKTKKEYISRKKEAGIGSFAYEEITFYERILDSNYKKLVFSSWDTIHDLTDKMIEAKDIGDRLASTGTLGKINKI